MQVEWTRCNAASNGTMSTVVKQRRVMTSHDNVTRFSVHNGSDLVISDVTVADAGVYLCTEDDGFGTKYPIVLHVLPDGMSIAKAFCYLLHKPGSRHCHLAIGHCTIRQRVFDCNYLSCKICFYVLNYQIKFISQHKRTVNNKRIYTNGLDKYSKKRKKAASASRTQRQ